MFTPTRLAAIGSVLFLAIVAGCVSQSDYNLLKTHNDELNAQLMQSKADAAATQKSDQTQLAANKKQIDDLTADVEKYKSAGKDAVAGIDQLKTKLDKDEADLNNARAYRATDQEKIKQLQQSVETATASLDEAKKSAADYQTRLTVLQAQLSQAQTDKDDLQKELTDLKAKATPTTKP